MLRRDQSNRPDTAVSINNRFLPAQLCKLHCFTVKLLRLHRINLIKRCRRNSESAAAENIFNIPLSKQNLLFIPQNQAVRTVIHILHHCCDFRMSLQQCIGKISLGRENRRCRHKNHHNLTCGKASSHQHIAKQAIARILIINLDFKRTQHPADCPDNLIRKLVLNQTFLYRDHAVRTFLIDSGNRISFPISVKNSGYLIPVIPWIFHTDNRFEMPFQFRAFLQFMLYKLFFFLQLFLIGHVQIFAVSALFFIYTLLFHILIPYPSIV